MKKLLLSLLLIPVINSTTFPIELHELRDGICKDIIMPPQEVLAVRLRKAGFGYYDEKTKISHQLGSQEKHPLGIPILVKETNYDFNKYVGNDGVSCALTQMRTPSLMRVLLEDHPETITCLEKLGVLPGS